MQNLKIKYTNIFQTQTLIFVTYQGKSNANVDIYQKTVSDLWKKIFECNGYVGKNGIYKEKEGDKKTPAGVFQIIGAFGIEENPGTKLSYLKIEPYHYWCTDQYYNQLIDIRKKPHPCRGEHLIDYQGAYDYGLFLDYNKECQPGKGSAIFMHCITEKPYTEGCIAVPKKHMKKILKIIEKNTKIVIM